MNVSLSTDIKTEQDIFKQGKVKWNGILSNILTKMSTTPNELLPPPSQIRSPMPLSKIRSSFNQFISGEISQTELVKSVNFSKTLEQEEQQQNVKILGKVLKFKSKLKHKVLPVDERKNYLQSKMSTLRQLIQYRVTKQKSEQDPNRGLIQTINEIVEQKQQNKTQNYFFSSRPLKTMRVSYNNLKPILRSHQEEYVDIKQEIKNKSDDFLESINKSSQLQELRLKRQTHKQLQKDKSFLPYFDCVTSKDVELYDYMHNPPLVKNQLKFELFKVRDAKPLTKDKKQSNLIRQTHDDECNVSHASSLQSTYEIYLDGLYSHAIDLKSKLKTKASLPKKIKGLLKIDKVDHQQMQINKYKLML